MEHKSKKKTERESKFEQVTFPTGRTVTSRVLTGNTIVLYEGEYAAERGVESGYSWREHD